MNGAAERPNRFNDSSLIAKSMEEHTYLYETLSWRTSVRFVNGRVSFKSDVLFQKPRNISESDQNSSVGTGIASQTCRQPGKFHLFGNPAHCPGFTG
jgi:hypothetical protein